MPQANKPAMISGPGALSQRTDGGAGSKQAIRYAAGEPGAEDFVDLQSQAAMAKAPTVKPATPAAMRDAVQAGQPQQITPLDAPSQYPDQHVTHGAEEAATVAPATGQNVDATAYNQRMATYMPALMFIQGHPDTSPDTRIAIQQLREIMP